MLDDLRRWFAGAFRGTKIDAATQLPPVVVPKVRPNQQSIPGYIKNTRSNADSVLPRTDRALANSDALTLRGGTSTREVIKNLAKVTPDLSAAVFAYPRTAITASYTATARNMDGTFNREATLLLQQLLVRFDIVQDYNDGFSGIWSLRSLSESLAKELMLHGAASVELVLDKGRLPRGMKPVPVSQIEFKADDRWLKPVQRIGSDTIDLDIATFFYIALDQDLLEPYADSPLEAAIQPVLADLDFFNDLRRLVKRALHPRLDVKINEEKFRATIPESIRMNPTELAAYTVNVMAEVQTKINELNPEDALVHFDFIEISYINHGNASPAGEEEILTGINRSRVSSASKTLPSILGHGGSTSNVASTESMLFMKNCSGAVQYKLNEIYSRALTLAVRLFGLDVYVEFAYEEIDLRPAGELEAFKAMKQSRVLQQLSLGFVTDDEASIMLTGKVTPAGFKPLSGTGFLNAPAAGDPGNPTSNTSTLGNKQGALNQTLKPSTPTQPKS